LDVLNEIFLGAPRNLLNAILDPQKEESTDFPTGRNTMLFMVIERFKNRDAKAVYSRFKEKGRMMPDGLKYVGSWVEDNFDRCFQLMECDDPRLFQQWLVHWEDLGDFEIVHVVSSAEAADAALSGRDLPRTSASAEQS
jgi:uncharacterized protein DUF3303